MEPQWSNQQIFEERRLCRARTASEDGPSKYVSKFKESAINQTLFNISRAHIVMNIVHNHRKGLDANFLKEKTQVGRFHLKPLKLMQEVSFKFYSKLYYQRMLHQCTAEEADMECSVKSIPHADIRNDT